MVYLKYQRNEAQKVSKNMETNSKVLKSHYKSLIYDEISENGQLTNFGGYKYSHIQNSKLVQDISTKLGIIVG